MAQFYNGNPNIKGGNVKVEYTQEQIQEYVKCSEDPIYFCKTYLKIVALGRGVVPFELYPYQEKMIRAFAENRFSVVLACRQSGKSSCAIAFLVWFILFHNNVTIAILANKGAIAREMLSRLTLMLEHIPFFLQPGCKILNKGNIELDNGSKAIAAATSSSAIRGLSVDVVMLDELGFVNRATEFYTSVYPVLSSGKNSKAIITSTANGVGNLFYNIYQGAVAGTNEFKAMRIDWYDVPGRDEEWKRQTIANTSERQFQQEFGNCLGSNSQTTIRLNNVIYEIEIGRLFEALRRSEPGKSCGLPLDEEIRLAAIRWYDDEEETTFKDAAS